VSGVHRSTTESPVAAARKSAPWVIQLLALVTAPLALLAFVAYLVIAQPAWPWLLPLAVVLLAATWIWVLTDLARPLLRRQPPPPAYWPGLTRHLPLVLGTTSLLLSHWSHGGTKSALTWCFYLFMGAYACWLIGERRLLAGPQSRGRQQPPAC
jgi:hypothetical protein